MGSHDKFWGNMQKEIGIWAARNFPEESSTNQLLGMIEEFGELCEAPSEEDYKDAVGDAMIYLCNYTRLKEIDLDELHDRAARAVGSIGGLGCGSFSLEQLGMRSLCKLVHHHLKEAQKIREEGHLNEIKNILVVLIRCLNNAVVGYAWTVKEAFSETWLSVAQRDWVAHREKGNDNDNRNT